VKAQIDAFTASVISKQEASETAITRRLSSIETKLNRGGMGNGGDDDVKTRAAARRFHILTLASRASSKPAPECWTSISISRRSKPTRSRSQPTCGATSAEWKRRRWRWGPIRTAATGCRIRCRPGSSRKSTRRARSGRSPPSRTSAPTHWRCRTISARWTRDGSANRRPGPRPTRPVSACFASGARDVRDAVRNPETA